MLNEGTIKFTLQVKSVEGVSSWADKGVIDKVRGNGLTGEVSSIEYITSVAQTLSTYC